MAAQARTRGEAGESRGRAEARTRQALAHAEAGRLCEGGGSRLPVQLHRRRLLRPGCGACSTQAGLDRGLSGRKGPAEHSRHDRRTSQLAPPAEDRAPLFKRCGAPARCHPQPAMIPRATYRLQFHKGFTFDDAARHADYFAELGVSHIYASPILTARAGSMHGYDVVDHRYVNPELGGEDGFRAMAHALRDRGLGLIVDIVPNHMAVGKADNEWWLDLLANGPASHYARAFDIDW